MEIEIWSDVVCPWCYIGKRRFEAALTAFAHADAVRVTWRSFELDPGAPARYPGTLTDLLARKRGTTPAQAAEANARLTGVAASATWLPFTGSIPVTGIPERAVR